MADPRPVCQGGCRVFDLLVHTSSQDNHLEIVILGAILAFILGLGLCFLVARTCLRPLLLRKAKETMNKRNSEANQRRREIIERNERARMIYTEDSSSYTPSASESSGESSSDNEQVEPIKDLLHPTPNLKSQDSFAKDSDVISTGSGSDLRIFTPQGFKPSTSCFAEALILSPWEKCERELVNQRVVSTATCLHSMRLEKFTSVTQVLRVIMTKFKKDGKIESETGNKILYQTDRGLEEEWGKAKKDYFGRIHQIERFVLDKTSKKLQVVFPDSFRIKTPEDKENAIKEAQTSFVFATDKVIGQLLTSAQQWLASESDLDYEEIAQLVRAFQQSMSHLEKLLSDEHLRNNMALKRQLSKRVKIARGLLAHREHWERCEGGRAEGMRLALKSRFSDKELDQLLPEYLTSLHLHLHTARTKMDDEKSQAASAMQQRRMQQLQLLEQNLGQLESDWLKSDALKIKSAQDFLQAFHDLQKSHRDRRIQLEEEIDQSEVKELSTLLNQPTEKSGASDLERKFVASLERANLIGRNDVDYLLRSFDTQHRKLCDLENRKLTDLVDTLNKEYAKNKEKMKESNTMLLIEQKMVTDLLTSALNNLVNQNESLDQQSRELIVLEFEDQLAKLNNILTVQKILQYIELEYKTAERNSKLAALKDKQSEELNKTAASSRDRVMRLQAEELAKEKKRIDAENTLHEMSVRTFLARQMEASIATHEKEMSHVIGRITAEGARRHVLLERQNRAIGQLQERMLDQVSQKGEKVSDGAVHKVLEDHRVHTEKAKDGHSSGREQQMEMLRQRMEAKRKQKAEVARKMVKSETKKLIKENDIRNEGVQQLLLKQKEEEALLRVDRELSEEERLERQVLERRLHRELEENLENSRKDFISKMAVLGNLNEEEIKDSLLYCITETGMDPKRAKALAKDIKRRFKDTRNVLERQSSFQRERSRTSYNDDSDDDGR